jgi:hypothetical protein
MRFAPAARAATIPRFPAASLVMRLSSGQIGVAMTNRLVAIASVTAALLRPVT